MADTKQQEEAPRPPRAGHSISGDIAVNRGGYRARPSEPATDPAYETLRFMASRAVVDDLTREMAYVRRRRTFAIAVYTASDDYSDAAGAQDIVRRTLQPWFTFLPIALVLTEGSYGAVLFAETQEPVTRDGLLYSIKEGFVSSIGEMIGKGLATGTVVLLGGAIGLSVFAEEGRGSGGHARHAESQVLVISCPPGKELDFTTSIITARTAGDLRKSLGECKPVGRFEMDADRK